MYYIYVCIIYIYVLYIYMYLKKNFQPTGVTRKVGMGRPVGMMQFALDCHRTSYLGLLSFALFSLFSFLCSDIYIYI